MADLAIAVHLGLLSRRRWCRPEPVLCFLNVCSYKINSPRKWNTYFLDIFLNYMELHGFALMEYKVYSPSTAQKWIHGNQYIVQLFSIWCSDYLKVASLSAARFNTSTPPIGYPRSYLYSHQITESPLPVTQPSSCHTHVHLIYNFILISNHLIMTNIISNYYILFTFIHLCVCRGFFMHLVAVCWLRHFWTYRVTFFSPMTSKL